MNFSERKEKCWLIRSNKRVLGPYSFQEIIDQILSGEVHVLDEVAGSLDRWRNIKDNPHFSAAIEQIRFSARSIGDNTVTSRMDSTQTITKSMTQSITQSMTQSMTKSTGYTDESTSLGIGYQSKKEPQVIDQNLILENALGIKKNKTQKKMFNYYLLAIPILLGAFYYAFSTNEDSKKIKSQNAFQENISRAYQLKHTGMFHESLAAFRLAFKEKSSDVNLSMELAPLLIQYGADSRTARQIVENALASRHEDDFFKRSFNVIGLAYSYENKFSEATANYKKGLEKDANDFSLNLNAGYNFYLAKNFELAEQHLKRAIYTDRENIIPVIYLAKNYLDWSRGSDSNDFLAKADKLINSKLASANDGKNELILMKTTILVRQKAGLEEVNKFVDKLLDSDPMLTLDHYHDPTQDIRGLIWSSSEGYCREVLSYVGEGVKQKLYGAYCSFLTGHITDAKNSLELLQQSPEVDVPVRALLAEVYEQMGDSEKSSATYKYISDAKTNFSVHQKVGLRHCIKSQPSSCISTIADKINKDEKLFFTTANAYLASYNSNKSEKARWLKAGLAISPKYLPLIRLSKSVK